MGRLEQETTLYLPEDLKILEVRGADAPPYLQRMLTQEVLQMPVGEARWSALLDRKGMVQSFFTLLRGEEDRFFIIGNRLAASRAFETLRKMKFQEKVEVTDLGTHWRVFSLMGPEAERRARASASGPSSVWRDPVLPVWSATGPEETLSPPSLPTLSREGMKLLQMEIGLPEYGVDLTDHHILLEAAVPYAFARRKGCYPGQEVVERICTYGKGRAPRSLVTLAVEGRDSIPPATPAIAPDGAEAGKSSSCLWNEEVQKSWVMATIEHKYLDRIGELSIQHRPVVAVPSSFSLKNVGDEEAPKAKGPSQQGRTPPPARF